MNTDIFKIPAQFKFLFKSIDINKNTKNINEEVINTLVDKVNLIIENLSKAFDDYTKRIKEDTVLLKLQENYNNLKDNPDKSKEKEDILANIKAREKLLADDAEEINKLIYIFKDLSLNLKDNTLNTEKKDNLIKEFGQALIKISSYTEVLPSIKENIAATQEDLNRYINDAERAKAIDNARIDYGLRKNQIDIPNIDIKEKATHAVSWFNKATDYAEIALGVIGSAGKFWQEHKENLRASLNGFIDSLKNTGASIWESTKDVANNLYQGAKNFLLIPKGWRNSILKNAKAGFSAISSNLAKLINSKFAQKIISAGKAIGRFGSRIASVGAKAISGISKFGSYLLGPFGTIIRGVAKGLGKITNKIPGLIKGLGSFIGGANKLLKSGFQKVTNIAKSTADKIKSGSSWLWGKVKSAGNYIADSKIGKTVTRGAKYVADSKIGQAVSAAGRGVAKGARAIANSSVGKRIAKVAGKGLKMIPGVGQVIALGLTAWDTVDNYRAYKTIFPKASFKKAGLEAIVGAASSQISFGFIDPMQMTRDVAAAINARLKGTPDYELESKICQNGGKELLATGLQNNNLDAGIYAQVTPLSPTVEKSDIKNTGIDSVARHDFAISKPENNTVSSSALNNNISNTMEYNTNTYSASTMTNTGLSNGQYKEGWISELGETGKVGGGSTSTISTGKGDYGGASYGKHQFASTNGVVQDFIKQSGFANEFAGLKPGTAEFNNKWKQLAENKDFQAAEEAYYQKSYVLPIVAKLQKQGIDISNDPVMKELAISSSVQFGAGGASNIFAEAFKNRDYNSLSTEDKIKILSAYKKSDDFVARKFRSSSSNVRAGVQKRFGREEQLALNMLKALENNKLEAANDTMLAVVKPETIEKLNTQQLAKPETKQQQPIIINNQQSQPSQMLAQNEDYSPKMPDPTYSGFGRGQINWYS